MCPMKHRSTGDGFQAVAIGKPALVFVALFSVLAMLAISGCGSKGANTTTPPPPPPTPGSTAVSVTPHSSSVATAGKEQFSATVTGNTNTAVTWSASGGTITAAGLFTAPSAAGTYTVSATSQADNTKSDVATVTVTSSAPTPTPPPPTPVSVVISPKIINLATGATQQFTALVSGTTNTAVTWTASAGTISAAGLYTAPASAGTPTVTATSVADKTKTASATILVGGAGSTLAQAAAGLTPGQWFHFTTAENTSWNGGGVLDLGPNHNATDNATAWSTKALWNPVTKEFYFVGGGHCGTGNDCVDTQQVLRYVDGTNTWNVSFRAGTHTYEGPAINTTAGPNNNVYLRLYSSNQVDIYNIASQSWGPSLALIPTNGSPNCCNALEYFPDRDSLLAFDNDNGIFEYTFAGGKWSGTCVVNTLLNCGAAKNAVLCPTHTTAAPWARYDPVHHQIYFGGCTAVYTLSTTLGVAQAASSPFDISVGSSASPITIDPSSGKLISWDASGNTYISDGTTWTNSAPSPFSDPVNGGLVCTPVSTYNAVMCLYAGKQSIPVTAGAVWLYRAP